ncbi:MAG TPA: glutaminase, partial [Solirubrobacterales bacterium]|nr:glutaminase [Solirubrobacterales bacterium]
MTESVGNNRTASPVQALLERLHARHAGDLSGEVASYIPELAGADPEWFGISMVTADGSVYEVGDTRREFTIQSISKPLTFALALEA